MSQEVTRRILITKTPRGPLPIAVREAWVGRILPCFPTVIDCDEPPYKPIFVVPQDLAIEVMEQDKPRMAGWLKRKGFPKANKYFGFGIDEAELLSGVIKYPQIRPVDEEMQGQPDR